MQSELNWMTPGEKPPRPEWSIRWPFVLVCGLILVAVFIVKPVAGLTLAGFLAALYIWIRWIAPLSERINPYRKDD